MHIYIHVHTYIYTYIHTYTHTHTHLRLREELKEKEEVVHKREDNKVKANEREIKRENNII